MYSSTYQPQFFTQQRPAGQHQASKFPPASQPGVHSSSMSLSQSFSQPQPQLQPSPYSQLPPSSAVQRPGSAGAQGRFLTSKGLCASQPMTQLSEEQLFLSNTQMRNPAALRPRSAAFAELSNSSARASNSQMGSPLTASQNGIVKDVLQELERKQQASLTAQQKQFDSIEKQQTSILDCIALLSSKLEDQTSLLQKLQDVPGAVQDMQGEFKQQSELQASFRQRSTADQACQTEEICQAPAAVITASNRNGAARAQGLGSAVSRLLQVTTQQPTSTCQKQQAPSAVQPILALLPPAASWRQQKISGSGLTGSAHRKEQQPVFSITQAPQLTTKSANPTTYAHHVLPSAAIKPAGIQTRSPHASNPAAAKSNSAKRPQYTASPSTIFSFDQGSDSTASHAQMSPRVQADLDDEDLARVVRAKMAAHRSKRMKRMKL